MAYLYEDSKYVLNQLESPFKGPQAQLIKGESADETAAVPAKSKAKRRKENEPGVQGHNPSTLKLDLKNSKWWNTGFDTNMLQEHLNRFLTQNGLTM